MPMVSLKLMAGAATGEEYGSCVSDDDLDDGCRDSRAMVCKEGAGGGPREAIPGGVMGARVSAYRVLAARGRRWGRARPWSR
jgi:hypothetical protein